jgi:hypothetical protein
MHSLSRHDGYVVSIRAEFNLTLCVFYLRHQETVNRVPTAGGTTLEMVRSFKDQQRWELDDKKTVVEPVSNEKDWPQTLENIRDYLAIMLGVKGSHLAYVVGADVVVPDAAEDFADGYITVEQEIFYRVPHSGPAFRNDRHTVWDVVSNICGHHEFWIYIKPAQRAIRME